MLKIVDGIVPIVLFQLRRDISNLVSLPISCGVVPAKSNMGINLPERSNVYCIYIFNVFIIVHCFTEHNMSVIYCTACFCNAVKCSSIYAFTIVLCFIEHNMIVTYFIACFYSCVQLDIICAY